MLSVMTYFFDTKTLVIYSVLPQILVGVIGLIRSPKTVKADFFVKMVLFASIGAVAGISIFYYLPHDLFHQLLASAITIFGLYLVASPKIVKLNNTLARILDITAGASQALFGISGPIAMTRLLHTFEDKTVIRNYALAFFFNTQYISGRWIRPQSNIHCANMGNDLYLGPLYCNCIVV